MKEIMKLLALLFVATAVLTFASCSSDDDDDDDPDTTEDSALVGSWKLSSMAGALAVGPAAGSADWWFNTEEDLTARACLFDDVWTFSNDGKVTIDLGDQTWIETWQGVDAEACGSPVAPHSGGEFDYEASETAITLSGAGAYIGLAKAFNGGELSDGTSAVPSSREYTILEISDTTLKLDMPIAGEGHWTFTLSKQ